MSLPPLALEIEGLVPPSNELSASLSNFAVLTSFFLLALWLVKNMFAACTISELSLAVISNALAITTAHPTEELRLGLVPGRLVDEVRPSRVRAHSTIVLR